MCRPWFALALLASLGPAPAVCAEEPASEADKLILQGVKLREQGQDSGALLLFERAYELAPTPRALAQRALAEQALGSWVEAERHLTDALAAEGDAWIDTHRVTLERSLGTIGEHLGNLQVNGGLPGAELRIDGQLVGTLPLAAPLRVVVGRSLLEITLAGYYPVKREIAVRAGALSTETIELAAVPAQPEAAAAPPTAVAPQPQEAKPATAPRPAPASSGLPSVVFWSGVVVTAALGGVTVWSGLNTQARNDAYVAYTEMKEQGATYDEGKKGYDSAQTAETRTNVLIAGTAVAGAATAVIGLFFTDWGGAEGEAEPAAARVRVLAADGRYGVAFDQRF